jgi:peptidoglycan/xylan/chitin deacetylase (PgdA/CDA1 family)
MSGYIPSVLILLYHRVAGLPTDPQMLSVTPQHFKEHLEILGSHACPIPLKQLVNALKEGNVPNRGVVVTFDDGYTDNLENAKPLLEQYGIPATIFISTGAEGREYTFWWDELEGLLLRPGKLPETLYLNVNGNIKIWELEEAAAYHEQDYWKNRGWNIMEKNDPSPRHCIYRFLYQQLRTLPSEEQQKILEDLSRLAGGPSLNCDDHLRLAPSEIKSLAKGGLVEIGAHTVTHPVLSLVPYAAQESEIRENKRTLEDILGYPPTSFAYPYGSKTDYTFDTVGIVRQAGFTCACANFPEIIWKGTDLFQLPRIIVRDWDGDTFACQLRSWWGG